LGPSISQESYEVGPDFPHKFLEKDANNQRYFLPSSREEHFLFDLKGYVAQLLERAGLSNVTTLENNTYAEEETFFSYRRATHRKENGYGNQMSVIGIVGSIS